MIEILSEKNSLLKVIMKRNFTLFWIGLLGFASADALFTLSFNWWIFEITGSEVQLSIIVMLNFLPAFIFSLFSGIITDRLNRKAILIVACLSRGIFIFLIPLISFVSSLEIWHLYILVFLQGSASTFFLITRGAIIPQLIDKENLMTANSLADISVWIAYIGGYFSGALLIEIFGTLNILILTSLMLLGSVVGFKLIHLGSLNVKEDQEAFESSLSFHSIFKDLRSGFDIVKDSKVVSLIIITWMGVQMFFAAGPMTIGWPIFSERILGSGSQGYGFLIVAISLSSFFGSVLIGQWGTKMKKGKLMILGFFWGSIGMFLFTLTRDLSTALVIAFLWNSCYPMINIPYVTVIQEQVPEKDMGKVFGISSLIGAAMTPISIVSTGLIMEHVSVILPFQLFAAALGFCGLIILWNKETRNMN
ncbi:MAG: MFS transporter [Promethearchaeota archaeon]